MQKNKIVKRIFLGISIAANIFILLLLVLSQFMKKPLAMRFLDMSADGTAYTSGACIVSVPASGAAIDFGCPSFSLKKGEEAALQFSVYSGGQQMNIGMTPLYDREIISAEPSGFALVIRALKPGETVMQVFSRDGVKDVARVTVTE